MGNRLGGRKKLRSGQITLLLMTIPSILFIFVFAYLPMSGWIYSFFDYRIGYKLSMCKFIGLDNFKYAFGKPYILKVLWNTISINLMGLLSIPVSCAIAIFLSEVRFTKFRRAVQTIITLPNFISWVIIYSICYALFSMDGLINTLLNNAFGLDIRSSVLSNPSTAKFFMVALNIWKGAGYGSILFFAAIVGIDSELIDAAKVDGAGRWQKIRYIIIPCLAPTFLVLLIINVGYMLSNGFDQYYTFMNPVIQQEIEVLDYYTYRIGMLERDIPVSTAVSMAKTFVSVFLIFTVNRLAKKISGNSIV